MTIVAFFLAAGLAAVVLASAIGALSTGIDVVSILGALGLVGGAIAIAVVGQLGAGGERNAPDE